MSRQNITAVLDAKGALEEALDEIAPGAEDDDDSFLVHLLFQTLELPVQGVRTLSTSR